MYNNLWGDYMKDSYLVIHTSVLPEIFEKVIEVKNMLKSNKVTEVVEAVKIAGISRTTYYKYKDYVFSLSDGVHNHNAILSATLSHKTGALSSILDKIALHGGNLLFINQDMPVHDTAHVTITFDILKLDIELHKLIEDIRAMEHILKVDLVAME